MKNKVFIYDTTLRDGAQKKGISYSLEDKIAIAIELDKFGIDYIEGGWPGSNPKDREFFEKVSQLRLQSKIVAFGSTRKKETNVEDDENIKALLSANTPAVAIVGKSSLLHVKEVIRTTPTENLKMIAESVSFCKSVGKEVVYDAEHFFDGYKLDSRYALETLAVAMESGADWLVLCDTNGGTMPAEVRRIVEIVKANFPIKIGIHSHNDCELAVANSIEAVLAGATQVQGTINGFGERCGNANLISVIPNLQLKMDYECVPKDNLKNLVSISRFVSERANFSSDPYQPFVGAAAFAHKGGIHVAAIERCVQSYEHFDPSLVGNKREIVISELSGKGNVRMLAGEWGVSKSSDKKALSIIKANEKNGYQYEGAEGSVELIMRQVEKEYLSPFNVTDYVVVSERRSTGFREDEKPLLEGVQAIVKLECLGEKVHTAAEGEGPVHALDMAFRKALISFYPIIEKMKLTDYKVRILDPDTATSAITRVLVEASMGSKTWTTVGCGRNIISASFKALLDSYELIIVRDRLKSTELLEKAI